VTTTPQAAAKFTLPGLPAPSYDFVLAQSDPNQLLQLLLATGNVSLAATVSTADAGKWWYNPADGWFYYIGVIAPAQSTAQLLDAVKLTGAAGNAYSNLTFDLIVKMQAIQALEDAIDGLGWPGALKTAIAGLA